MLRDFLGSFLSFISDRDGFDPRLCFGSGRIPRRPEFLGASGSVGLVVGRQKYATGKFKGEKDAIMR
jgi:hypothetical protein